MTDGPVCVGDRLLRLTLVQVGRAAVAIGQSQLRIAVDGLTVGPDRLVQVTPALLGHSVVIPALGLRLPNTPRQKAAQYLHNPRQIAAFSYPGRLRRGNGDQTLGTYPRLGDGEVVLQLIPVSPHHDRLLQVVQGQFVPAGDSIQNAAVDPGVNVVRLVL